MAARARAGQATPAGGSWCAHSAASDQVASTAGETPSTRTAAMCSRRSPNRSRYSRQLSRSTVITAAAWASPSGSPSRSSPRSSASARWSGSLVSWALRYASTSRRLNPPTGAIRGPIAALSLLFNLSVCGFFLGSGWPGGFPHVMAGGRAAVPGTGRAPGSWFAGFRCRCEGGQCAVDVPESLADPGGGQAAGRGGALPGQAEVFGDAAGEPELGQGGQDQPGPPVGGGGVAEPGAGPAEDLLEEPECVFDIETPQERLPAAVYPGGIRGGIGGPQPH